VLLSNWVIELVEAKTNTNFIKKELKKLEIDENLINQIIEIKDNNNLEDLKKILKKILRNKNIFQEKIQKIIEILWRFHIISTLRDWWAADKTQRTTTAWRNSWDNLNEDLEREHIEESPFLWFDSEWNFALATSNTNNESKLILKESIQRFLDKKYLKQWDENFEFVKKNFERNFPNIKYENLWEILNEIIKNDRFYTYNSESIDKINWMENDFKELELWNSKWKFFVYFDKKNNTIEYRKVRKITWFEEGFKPLSNRTWRLYLESENQFPKSHRVEQTNEWFVPTNAYFSDKYAKKVLNIL
jgi:hypothetical protein